MPALTLKNIPQHLYDTLKKSAGDHHRSINSEIIYCLEQNLMPKKISPEKRLEKIRSLRKSIGADIATPPEIRRAIETGRP